MKDVFCDLRLISKGRFVDIDVTVVKPQYEAEAFDEKIRKHTTLLSNNMVVYVLPLVFDTFGTIYSGSVQLMEQLIPSVDVMQMMAGVVLANANYITTMTMMELNHWHGRRSAAAPVDSLSEDAKEVLSSVLGRGVFWQGGRQVDPSYYLKSKDSVNGIQCTDTD